MDTIYLLKSAFAGFALCVGTLMLTFLIFGRILGVSRKYFVRTFILGGVSSFLVADAFLYYKIVIRHVEDPSIFLLGNVAGWLSGIFFGLTQMKKVLHGFLKGS